MSQEPYDVSDDDCRPWKPDGDYNFRGRPRDEEIWKPERPWHRDPWDPGDGLIPSDGSW